MMELADMRDLGSRAYSVQVRPLLPAPRHAEALVQSLCIFSHQADKYSIFLLVKPILCVLIHYVNIIFAALTAGRRITGVRDFSIGTARRHAIRNILGRFIVF